MQHREFFRLSGPRRHRSPLLAAAAAALPLAALGQALDVSTLREIDDDRTDVTHENLTIEQIEDMNVVREDTLVGEIEEVLVDSSDRIVAVVVDAASRSPGRRDREVVVPIERLEFDRDSRQARTTLTEDEIAALPAWND